MEVKDYFEGINQKFDALGALRTAEAKKMSDEIKAQTDAIAAMQKRLDLGYAGAGAAPVSEGMKSMLDIMACRESKAATHTNTGTIGNPATGGYLAAVEYQSEVIKRMYDSSPILGETRQYSISGNATAIAVEKDAPEVSFIDEIAENGRSTVKLGMATIALKDATVDVALSNALIRDSNIVNAQDYAISSTTSAYARKMGQVILNGDGAAQPQGILTSGALKTKKTGASTDVTTDAIFDIVGALPDEAEPNAKWFMKKSTFFAIVKKYGAASNYVNMGLGANIAPAILGHEVVFCGDMPDLSVNNKVCALYGDMRKAYATASNGGMSFIVDQYSEASRNATVYHFCQPLGGALIQPEAILGLKVGA